MPTPAPLSRQEFLQLFGLGAAGLLATVCLGGCGSSSGSPAPVAPPTGVSFTLDLTATTSSPLNDPTVGCVRQQSEHHRG